MIEAAIRSILVTESEVTNLVSSRVFVDDIEQGTTLPALVISRVSSYDEQLPHSGATGLGRARIQISCLCSGSLEAASVVKAVKDALNGYQGTVSGVRIDRCVSGNMFATPDRELGYMRAIEFEITHKE